MSDISPEELDDGVLDVALEERRRMFDQQTKSHRVLSRKAGRVLYANVATVAGVATLTRVLDGVSEGVLAPPLAGFVLSLFVSVWGYWTTTMYYGVGGDMLGAAMEESLTQNEVATDLVRHKYPDLIRSMQGSLDTKVRRFKRSILAYVLAIGFFAFWISYQSL